MLIFNIKRILEMRGVSEHYRWLVRNGFVPQTATTWTKYQIGYVKPEHIEKLCVLLNCTPNDLFEWREDDKTILPESHALRSLKRDKDARSATELLRDIPADKLEKLASLVDQLKDVQE